jgi:ribonuclease J
MITDKRKVLAHCRVHVNSGTSITFYGGVHEIGGNKFLIEDKGRKIFLDFGMQMGKVNQYFREFVNPRTCNGAI